MRTQFLRIFVSVCFAIAAISLVLPTGCATSKSSSQTQSHYAAFGTNRLHYVTAGKGEHTIVFVHCWAGNSDLWHEQVPALADKARLILVDLPGHGQSDKPHTDYTMDYFATAVLAVMRDAHVKKATLVGHSMGAPVICRVYKQAPEKVAALVAIDGTLRRPAVTSEQVERIKAPFGKADYRTHTTNFIAAMFPIPGTEALRDRILGELLETPQYVMVGAMEGMFGADQPDWDLKSVNVPVLVINAKNPMWTKEYEAYVRSLSPKTDYRVIDGVGHWLMLEKPDEFNRVLIDMLREFDLAAQ
jgi:pimeloyl-ACP methyl ester carboxylesterase